MPFQSVSYHTLNSLPTGYKDTAWVKTPKTHNTANSFATRMPCRIIRQQTGNEEEEAHEEREQMPKTKFSLHNIAHKIFFTPSVPPLSTQGVGELGHT